MPVATWSRKARSCETISTARRGRLSASPPARLEHRQVEAVGGLVQQQQVRAGEQHAGQRRGGFFCPPLRRCRPGSFRAVGPDQAEGMPGSAARCPAFAEAACKRVAAGLGRIRPWSGGSFSRAARAVAQLGQPVRTVQLGGAAPGRLRSAGCNPGNGFTLRSKVEAPGDREPSPHVRAGRAPTDPEIRPAPCSGQDAQQGGFAAAVRPDQAEPLAGIDAETDIR